MTDQPEADESRPTPHRRFRLVLTGVLVVLLVAAAGVLVWLLAERRGVAEEAQREREAALGVTEQFVLRINDYGPGQLDDQGRLADYRDQVLEVLTPKFGSDFEKTGLPIAEKTVADAGYGRTAEVFGSGVERIDGDSATVLIAGSFTGSYPDPKAPKDESRRTEAEPAVLRWSVDLVKIDDEWLVDDYAAVSAQEQQ